eukprot:5909732-Ditylum_brightwellii.AAC.1
MTHKSATPDHMSFSGNVKKEGYRRGDFRGRGRKLNQRPVMQQPEFKFALQADQFLWIRSEIAEYMGRSCWQSRDIQNGILNQATQDI